ncbi:MAG: hypothetical protein OER12_02210 [Acidimicrobiia bacterium]|nr:hypothetical protein [Acidimicrobiia bacterium]
MVVLVTTGLTACSEEVHLTFTVEGNTCTHDGGDELYRRPSINLINNSNREAGIKLWTVPAGTTADDLAPGAYTASEPQWMAFADPNSEGSGGTTLTPGNRAMVECFFNDVPPDEGTISRAFFDIP